MKTILAFVLLLALAFGYFEYKQRLEILDLQTQCLTLQNQVVELQASVAVEKQTSQKQNRSITHLQSREDLDETALLKIIQFINDLEVIPAPTKQLKPEPST
jgi:hypothetical protein